MRLPDKSAVNDGGRGLGGHVLGTAEVREILFDINAANARLLKVGVDAAFALVISDLTALEV